MDIKTLAAELKARPEVREYICHLLKDGLRTERLPERDRQQLARWQLTDLGYARLLTLRGEGIRPLLTDWQICFLADHLHADAFLQAVRIVEEENETEQREESQDPAFAMVNAR